MRNFRKTALAGAIPLALLAMPSAQAASTEALEQRIRDLENRLKKLDRIEAEAAPSKPAAVSPEVEKLTKKLNTLERKFEVEQEVSTANAAKLPKIDVGSDGVKFGSSDGKHQVRLRGSVQADGRFYAQNPNGSGSSDRFELKQGRVWLEGKFWDSLYFKIMPDFAASNILPDAYLDYAYLPYASLSAGKQKTPLSLERLQGDSDGLFMERAFPTYLASNRDVGVMLHGEFAKPGYKTEYGGPVGFKNFVSYQVGVFNGSGDDGSVDKNSPDTDRDKAVVGRLWAQPFQHSGNGWLEGLGLGVAGSYERPTNQALKTQATPNGRTNFLNYSSVRTGIASGASTGAYSAVLADGEHYRIYPQAYWYVKQFGLMGEYVLSSQSVLSNLTLTNNTTKATSTSGVRGKIGNTAWQVQASYVLTGEDNTFQSVKPLRPFNPLNGGWGALQAAARWSEFDVDNQAFQFLDPAKSASHASSWALGLNWYLNQNARIMADYEQTSFEGGAGTTKAVLNKPTDRVFGTRFQLAF